MPGPLLRFHGIRVHLYVEIGRIPDPFADPKIAFIRTLSILIRLFSSFVRTNFSFIVPSETFAWLKMKFIQWLNTFA